MDNCSLLIMSEVDLSFLISEEFRKVVEDSHPEENSEAFTLLTSLYSTSMSTLVSLPLFTVPSLNILLNSLILNNTYKDPSTSLQRLPRITESYSYLISNKPEYFQAFSISFTESLINLSMKSTSIDEILSIAVSAQCIKKAGAVTDTLFCSLSNQFTGQIWDLINSIYSNVHEKATDIEKLIIYLVRAEDLGINTESYKDRALDVLIQFIETQIEFVGRIKAEEERKEVDGYYADTKKLIGLSKHLGVSSNIYARKLSMYESTIGYLGIKRDEFEKKSQSESLVQYSKSEVPMYAREHGSVSVALYRGTLLNSGIKVVIKIYSKLNEHCDLKAFGNEVKIFEMLSDRATPTSAFLKFYGATYEKDKLIMIIESCDMDLMSKITEMKGKSISFTDEQITVIATQLISSFADLVQLNIFHQDIKPHNILINEDFTVKITDFSVSDIKIDFSATRATNTHPIQGTMGYMAPELEHAIREKAQHAPAITKFNPEKADVFSLGLTLLQMRIFEDLTTLNLRENENKLKDIIKLVRPFWFCTLLEHMLEFDPARRSTFKQLLTYFPQADTMVA